MEPGGRPHHIEIYVSDLERARAFWDWKLHDFYLVIVQVSPEFSGLPFNRRAVGLNHIAFHAQSRGQVDRIAEEARGHGVRVLYEDRHPFAGGPEHYAVYLSDPDGIKVEVVAPG